jgi:hypothetical protein
VRVFLTKWIARYVRREGIAHSRLYEAVSRAETGLIDADLGGGLIKQRVARSGKGRSGGYRMVFAYRPADRAIFLLAFAKSETENITTDELKTARELGSKLLAFTAAELEQAKHRGEIEEVPYEAQSQHGN